jgi:hypothetical protein
LNVPSFLDVFFIGLSVEDGQGVGAIDMLRAPLDDLPPVEFAFAYGSGVFEQPGNSHLTQNEVFYPHQYQFLVNIYN